MSIILYVVVDDGVTWMNIFCVVAPVFLPGHGSNVNKLLDPTIAAKGVFSMGMGDGGTPISLALPGDIDLDFGYLKVFLTTQPVDFYPFMQDSPFHDGPSQMTRSNVTIILPRPQRSEKRSFHALLHGGNLANLRRVKAEHSMFGSSKNNISDEPLASVSLKYALVQKRTRM